MNTANKIEKMSAIWKRVGHTKPIYGMLELTDKQIDRIKRILDERETKTRPARIAESDRLWAISAKYCAETKADVDDRECCEMCGDKTSHEVWTDYNGDEVLYCDDCYYRHRVRIEQKCPECRFRQRCPNLSICGAPNTNLCAICDPDEE